MGIIAFIVLGLLAGIIAKALLPGMDPGGLIITAIIGVVGALLGASSQRLCSTRTRSMSSSTSPRWLTAIIGSVILLLIYRAVVGRSGGTHRSVRA